MKKYALLLTLGFCALTFAAEGPKPPPGFEWITPELVAWLEGLPYVGPFVVAALQYVGLAAAAFTAAVVALRGLVVAAKGFAWALKLTAFSAWVERAYGAVYPWLAYLSIFNAPKPQLPRRLRTEGSPRARR